jgi:hypothetical protein
MIEQLFDFCLLFLTFYVMTLIFSMGLCAIGFAIYKYLLKK